MYKNQEKKITQEQKLYDNIYSMLELVRELITTCYEKGYKIVHPNLIQIAGGFLTTLDKEKLMINFLTRSYAYWDIMYSRNDDFFFDNASEVFKDLPEKHVQAFQVLHTAKDNNGNLIIPYEDRSSIWDYIHSQVKVSLKYLYDKRKTDKNFLTKKDVNYKNTKVCISDEDILKYIELYRVNVE